MAPTWYGKIPGRVPRGLPDDPFSGATDDLLTYPGETLLAASQRFGIFDVGDLKSQNKSFNNTDVSKPQPVKVTGPPEIISTDVTSVVTAMESFGYKVAKNDSKDYNLNIVGLRSDSTEANKFDDQIWVFWRYENKWTLKKYKATTDPGLSWLYHPENKFGTAILKEGQYHGSHQLGKHHGVYEALVQAGPVTVIRDFNRDSTLDYNSGKEQTGVFGINIHRANEKRESVFVDKWSAGCQVFARPNEFGEFMKYVKCAVGNWGNSFTYTLMRASQVK